MTAGRPSVRKSRLLVLASTYPRWKGDPEPAFVHDLSRRLVDRFEVTVLCPHAPGALISEEMDGVQVVRYRYAPVMLQTLVNNGGIVTNLKLHAWKYLLLPTFTFVLLWKLWRLTRKGHFDVVHAHWLLPQGLASALLRCLPGPGVRFVVTSHGADLYALQGLGLRLLKRFTVRRAAAVTVVSRAMRIELERVGVDGRKVLTLPMGVDLRGRFTPDDSERDPFHILFVGRLVEKKGLRVLLDALPEILQRYPLARLTVAGFGPERDALRRQAEALGIGQAVDFIGAVPQARLPALYRRAAVFVAPFVKSANGDREGLGLVTIEAIACGCPVVVSALPAVADILDADEDGEMLFRPGDHRALATAVNNVLGNARQSGDRALKLRRRVVQNFDWEIVASRYGDLLSNVGAQR